MGIGPIDAVNKLLKRFDLKVDDIGLWELNEAFAVQVLYSAEQLGIPEDRMNVDGGSISIGHPYGMSGARMTGHALIEGKRRGVEVCRRHDVRRRRHGRGRAVRGALADERGRTDRACLDRQPARRLAALSCDVCRRAGDEVRLDRASRSASRARCARQQLDHRHRRASARSPNFSPTRSPGSTVRGMRFTRSSGPIGGALLSMAIIDGGDPGLAGREASCSAAAPALHRACREGRRAERSSTPAPSPSPTSPFRPAKMSRLAGLLGLAIANPIAAALIALDPGHPVAVAGAGCAASSDRRFA